MLGTRPASTTATRVVHDLHEKCACGAEMTVPQDYYNFRDNQSAWQIIVEWRTNHGCPNRK